MAFVDAYRDRFGVEPICRALTEAGWSIGPSTFYAAHARPPSARAVRDGALVERMRQIQGDRTLGRGVYGARKMWNQLRREGQSVARCTVERLMGPAGLRGIRRGGERFITTRPGPATALRPPDLVNRQFTATRPNQLWVVDFTYVWTLAGMMFTAFVSDVFSRRIVGWRTAARMPTDLPLDALEMALWVRGRDGHRTDGLVHHSDAGVQYTAIRYHNRLLQAGALASIGTVGDSYDNAMAESLIGLYKAECVSQDGPFRGLDDLELATAEWVHWFVTSRLHSMIGYVPPVEFEAAFYAAHPNVA